MFVMSEHESTLSIKKRLERHFRMVKPEDGIFWNNEVQANMTAAWTFIGISGMLVLVMIL